MTSSRPIEFAQPLKNTPHQRKIIHFPEHTHMLKTFDKLRDLDIRVEGKRAVGSSSISGSLRLSWGATMWLMQGARSMRCRQARPLTRLGRLEERERPGGFSGSSMQDQVALGAKRSPTPVKGGIARAPGSQKPGDGHVALCTYGGAKRFLLMRRQDLTLSDFYLKFHECDCCATLALPHGDSAFSLSQLAYSRCYEP